LLDDAKSKGDWLVALLPTVNAAQYPLNRIHCRPFLLAAPLLAAPLAQDGHRLGLRKHFAGSLPDRPEVGQARRRQRSTSGTSGGGSCLPLRPCGIRNRAARPPAR